MLATKISFMNEMSNIADSLGADIEKVRNGIGSDSRIGFSFIYPGAGYGGSCFPKDVQALIKTAKGAGVNTSLLNATEQVNEKQKNVLFSKIKQHFGEDISSKTFAVWGLSFKPNTDDMRQATSLVLLEQLLNAGAKVQAYDPEALHECKRIFGEREGLSLVKKSNDALKNADCLVIVTEWNEFRNPDFESIKSHTNTIIDGRNMYSLDVMKELGFNYYSIGRKAIIANN
jgi:UDPglucose 6-dehydrogenase